MVLGNLKTILSKARISFQASMIIAMLSFGAFCASDRTNPPSREFFEEHLLGGLQLGSGMSQFKAKFEAATCREYPRLKGPDSDRLHSRCTSGPYNRQPLYLSLPGLDPFEVVRYDADFFDDKLESIAFQFLYRDYSGLQKTLEHLLGAPSSKTSKRISGLLGPTVEKNKITIWSLADYAIKLQSNPGGGGQVSIVSFYANTNPS